MEGVRNKRGRKREQHEAVKRRIGETGTPPVARAAKDVLERWVSGEATFAEVEAALEELTRSVEDLGIPRPSDTTFSSADEVAWAALEYRDAAYVASSLHALAMLAASRRDKLRADLISTVATKPAPPLYARRFFETLKAVGVGQDLLHPPTKPKALRVKDALERGAGDEDNDPGFKPGPLHQWSDLPRRFAGYEFVDTEDEHPFGDDEMVPLPPFLSIEEYAGPGDDFSGLVASPETLQKYTEIIKRWFDARKVDRLDYPRRWGWALLLAYRLTGSDEPLPHVSHEWTVFVSPWEEGKRVRAVKLPISQDRADDTGQPS